MRRAAAHTLTARAWRWLVILFACGFVATTAILEPRLVQRALYSPWSLIP